MIDLKSKKFILLKLAGLMIAVSFLFTSFAFSEENQIYLRYANEKVRLDIYNPTHYSCPIVILIHGAAGIEGDRAERYRGFATDLMNRGVIAINVHYFDSKKENWTETILQTINYIQNIPNADKSRIGIVGYSLGGTIALKVASTDKRVKVLAINSGFLPSGFTKEDAVCLPKTLIISGSEDSAINTLNLLKQWSLELGRSFQTEINEGIGHDNVPIKVFEENWGTIVKFLIDNL